jgi:hypothetical protein
VAVGLSGGFLEPLEASALVLIELSAEMISAQLPATRETMDIVARRFNETTRYRWDRIIDFLKLHYILAVARTPVSGPIIAIPPASRRVCRNCCSCGATGPRVTRIS